MKEFKEGDKVKINQIGIEFYDNFDFIKKDSYKTNIIHTVTDCGSEFVSKEYRQIILFPEYFYKVNIDHGLSKALW